MSEEEVKPECYRKIEISGIMSIDDKIKLQQFLYEMGYKVLCKEIPPTTLIELSKRAGGEE